MSTTQPAACVRRREHAFHPSSGWCVNGCGLRDDGARATPPLKATTTRPALIDVIDITEPRRSPHTHGTHTRIGPAIPGLEPIALPRYGSGKERS